MAQQHPQPGLARCYQHQDQETGVRCTRCDRPICPSCMVEAAVGYQCPRCVRGAAGATRAARPRTLAGGRVTGDAGIVTKILLAMNAVVFLAVLARGDEMVIDLGMLGYATDGGTFLAPNWIGVADGEWYRLLTSAFLHQEIWHFGFNMLGLWLLGPPLESALGRVRFVALYLLSALAGSTLSFVLADQTQLSLGASGAIFGLFGATAVLARRLRYDMRPILLLLAVNLVITFAWSAIAWQAHIGGLVAGVVIASGLVWAPRRLRLPVQITVCALVALTLLVTCLIRANQLVG
ncbi:Membrane associated serine protease, rhomboid family [Streptomyces zhaozhouensis]|uniref:Membrane associated serine protease, rhomboid family n=1 Tax=Streptomyces zhaozhouensis TaxID=1300267 RepID=A0A286DYI9_9ACTN|nr:rhomboid family intramembrane serine protease [Streptomyces zhaozhouensis]SOD63729.1 Membrane associated serine protease, rhomboid family [Streptomyces zhaozhouensis]